jgi:nickel-dependent lactate racemase
VKVNPDVAAILKDGDRKGWEAVEVEYGTADIPVRVPPQTVVLEMREIPPLSDPAAAMMASIHRPIGSPPLPDLIRAKKKPPHALRVCITTSDITRPVPYTGEGGILRPLLELLQQAGIRREQISLLVGTGTHRPSTSTEKVAMFGQAVVDQYHIVDHDCANEALLVDMGKTRNGTPILVNQTFCEADLKIATALVESHFMAGASGGRKAICPALVSWRTIERFHSADFLDSPRATNLVLEGNPCHEEALEIARTVGVDFIINTVLNRRLELLAVFSGDPVAAHERAVARLREIVAIPVERPFDVVLTHGGYVGINHYQNAKAAVNALPIVREGGIIILAACERDLDPIGPTTYKTLLHLLKLQGPDGYLATLRQPGWRFTKDQWEPQMWGKVLKKVGTDGMLYCSAIIPEQAHDIVPGRAGWEFLAEQPFPNNAETARIMVQNALCYAANHPRWQGARPRIAFLREGPYAVPFVR